jgi:hypothetical protein
MAAVKPCDHRERTECHCYRLVNPRGLSNHWPIPIAADTVWSFTRADQFDPGVPGSEMTRTPSAKVANAFVLDLRLQGRFEAPPHTGD